jgi:hypothetical protein
MQDESNNGTLECVTRLVRFVGPEGPAMSDY